MSYPSEVLKELMDNMTDDVKKRNPGVFGTATSKKWTDSPESFTRKPLKTEPKVPGESKPSKYHNQRTPYNGKVYDSKKEALHATELDLAVRAHIIDFWLYHVRFPLPCDTVYEADFVPFKCRGSASRNGLWEIEVHEVKGYWTPEAKRKMKLFKKHYPNIKVVII